MKCVKCYGEACRYFLAFLVLTPLAGFCAGRSACALSGLQLTAVGIEDSGNWVIVRTSGDGQEYVLDQGQTILSCLTVKHVSNNAALVEDLNTGEQQMVYLGGGSATQTPRPRSPSSTGPIIVNIGANFPNVQNTATANTVSDTVEQQIQHAATNALLEKIDSNVSKVIYPQLTSTGDLPKSIYWNESGDALFEDLERIGVGTEAVELEGGGVLLGANSRNTVLGSYGLTLGDTIVSVAGHDVKSPADIARYLNEAKKGAPVRIDYKNGQVENPGVQSTYLAIMPKTPTPS